MKHKPAPGDHPALVGRWREELQEELLANKKQTEALKRSLAKLKKALMKSDEPLKVSTECQHYRESRTGIDKV